MSWDGNERRKSNQGELCSQHSAMMTQVSQAALDTAVIKNSVKNIENQLMASATFKTGVIIALVGVALTMFLQVGATCYFYGQLVRQVEVNTEQVKHNSQKLSTITSVDK